MPLSPRAILLFLACVGVAACAHNGAHDPMAAASGVTHADVGKGPRDARFIPLTPMTGDVEILYGDPDVARQPFVMRIHELPGSVVPPHTHPVDENITVVQGTWYFGLGDTFDPKSLKELKTGSYAFAPAGSSMFGFCPEGAIVQVHGIGPFEINWHGGLHTLDDADAGSVFKFKVGAHVASPRGLGTIVHGYASDPIIQYELEAPGGEHFMADESALQDAPQ